MTREPYYNSDLTTIKPANTKNFSILSPDLPIITNNPNLKNAPLLNSPYKSIRKDSIEPYFNKPIKIGVLPPAILNQFTYYFHDESAIIDDDDDDDDDDGSGFEYINYSGSVIAPMNVLDKVSDNYEEIFIDSKDQEEKEEEYGFKFMKNVNVPVATPSTHSHIFEINKDDLLDKTNNPNVLINNRSRKLSDKLLAPDLQDLKFVNDSFEIEQRLDVKNLVRDDFINEPCSFII